MICYQLKKLMQITQFRLKKSKRKLGNTDANLRKHAANIEKINIRLKNHQQIIIKQKSKIVLLLLAPNMPMMLPMMPPLSLSCILPSDLAKKQKY